ncbi:MAG: hypothetical protein FGM40_03145 [Rhodocyclaceae bacterium]|nr:hypothetical protein [Rhodocyclaceae bacterium]
MEASQHLNPLGTPAGMWSRLGPPLRPSPGDLGIFQRAIDDWQVRRGQEAGAPRALILGATPELWSLAWPDRDKLLVLEPDPVVAAELWPGTPGSVEVRSWQTLSPADGHFDLVFCDAGLHTLGYPNEQADFRRRIAAVTARGALLAFRLLCPPSRHESTHRVTSELWSGNVGDMSQLIFRLTISMQRSPAAGVRLDTVWLKLRSLCKDWHTLSLRTGWDLDSVAVADYFRASQAKHHYFGLVEMLNRFGYSDGQYFQMIRLTTGGGALAAQCPVVTFERL